MDELLKTFQLDESFMGHYVKLIQEVVLPYQEKILKDEIEGVEKSHAVENFKAAAEVLETGKCKETFYGMVFQDSDVAKWLEAVAYAQAIAPDMAQQKRADEIIDIIGRAQHENGYLNTYFTVKEPGREWTDLCEAHELYCAGHMIEAAVAYAECTGKTKLLEIMERMADCIYQHFMVEGAPGYPGHPEVELALMRLYHYTGKRKYMELAEHFVDVRGVDSDYFYQEGLNRGWDVFHNDGADREYAQNHLPVREQKKAVGHAVRAVYLFTGVAEVALEAKDETLLNACKTIWENITQCRMYVTGAIGSAYEGEAFTKDYHLPNDTAYAETCAAIGLIFFARKMLDIEKNSTYADTMERALYNCVLAGMEQDGKKFFYVNPLEVIPGISGEAQSHRHTLPQRPEWFACACCPPNVARLLTSIAKYAWSVEDNIVYSHLFVGGKLVLDDTLGGTIRVATAFPSESRVNYLFYPAKDTMSITLAIRIPYWSQKTEILLNKEPVEYVVKGGYAYITKDFKKDDVIAVNFDMSVKRVYASSQISANSGKVCFMRGPLVYCAEGVDNEDDVLGLKVNGDADKVNVVAYADSEYAYALEVEGYKTLKQDELYSFNRPKEIPCKIKLIPYFTWGNRGLTQMRVWLPEE